MFVLSYCILTITALNQIRSGSLFHKPSGILPSLCAVLFSLIVSFSLSSLSFLHVLFFSFETRPDDGFGRGNEMPLTPYFTSITKFNLWCKVSNSFLPKIACSEMEVETKVHVNCGLSHQKLTDVLCQ